MTEPLFDPDELVELALLVQPARRPVETVDTAPGYFTDDEESP